MKKHYSFGKFFIVIISVIILGFALQILVSGILDIIDVHFPDLLTSYKQMIENSFSVNNGAFRVITVILLAPIAEELAFRGIALYAARHFIKGRFSSAFAVLLTALLFGIYHGNVVQGCYGFIGGIILALLVIWYSSLIPSVILHITINSSSYILNTFIISESKFIPLAIVSFILAAALLAILYILSDDTKYLDK